MRARFAVTYLLLSVGAVIGAAFAAAADENVATTSGPAADPALKPLQDFVGTWKGIGQVRRGSNDGAWIEESAWRWDFTGGAAAIVFSAPKSKHLVEGRITPSGETGGLTLSAKTAAGAELAYAGAIDADGAVTFKADDVPDGVPQRVVLRFAAEKQRLVAALERKVGGGDVYSRLAEVGYTRQGSNFGKDGATGPECIVTGGSAEIAVKFQDKTYWVCCTGCKDLFDEDPAQYVSAYEAKRKAKQDERK